LPEHKVASALVNIIHGPITGTSANLSGNTGYSRVPEFDPLIMDNLDLILDAGPLKGGKGSTVVDVTGKFPEVLREGEISAKDIFAVLK
jgi:L-threonylcarbamoyladenylate synthase